MKREKKVLLGGSVFAILIMIGGYWFSERKISEFRFGLLILLLFGLFYFISKFETILKKFNIETRIAGNLELRDSKKYGIVKCLNCGKHTISYLHAKKQAQKCGECGKFYKAINYKIRDWTAIGFVLVVLVLAKIYQAKELVHLSFILVSVFGAGAVLTMGGDVVEVDR